MRHCPSLVSRCIVMALPAGTRADVPGALPDSGRVPVRLLRPSGRRGGRGGRARPRAGPRSPSLAPRRRVAALAMALTASVPSSCIMRRRRGTTTT